MTRIDMHGTLLLAEEGLNGTVCGPRERWRCFSTGSRGKASGWPVTEIFRRSRTGIPSHEGQAEREIVTMGRPKSALRSTTGTYVDPADWNAWWTTRRAGD